MSDDLPNQFHRAMLTVYDRARRECRYNATLLLSMISQRGGLQTARDLLHSSTVSDGFSRLWELKRLDLTVEALVLQSQWQPLFTLQELAVARQRLKQLGYIPAE